MIYTITFNPSIDYVMYFDEVIPGKVNRSKKEEIFPGGKGINVSIVLSNLGHSSTALGFAAGFTGTIISEMLSDSGVICDFTSLPEGISRINVKIKENTETDLNGQGPEVSQDSLNELFTKLDKCTSDDIVVLAGSVPKSLPDDIYERIAEKLHKNHVAFIVDAEKQLLLNTLRYNPLLIKPNIDELNELFDTTITETEDIIKYAEKLQKLGAENVIVSLGSKGALLVAADGNTYLSEAPCGNKINAVGAGDSMVAGFISGYVNKLDYASSLKLATACGSATAFSPGIADNEMILKTLSITESPVIIR